MISTVRCFAVTSGQFEGSTFVQWNAHFSSDADAGKSIPEENPVDKRGKVAPASMDTLTEMCNLAGIG